MVQTRRGEHGRRVDPLQAEHVGDRRERAGPDEAPSGTTPAGSAET